MNFPEFIKFLNDNNGMISVIFSGIVMLATVIYALLTARLVKETRRMRELQTDARIEVVAEPLEEAINIFVLRFKNIGLGPAFDLKFNLYGESNNEGESLLINEFSKSKFITRGLTYLGPGQETHSGFTQMHDKYELKIKARLICEVSYSSHSGRRTINKIPIYLEEFEGYGKVGTSPLSKIAKAVENIDKNLGNAINGFKTLNVDTFTSKDRKIKEEMYLKKEGDTKK